jgi:FkbM family methyltransferase
MNASVQRVLLACRSVVNGLLGPLGLEMRRIPPAERHHDVWLRQCGIRTVLDIGANTGQFAQYILRVLPEAQVYSFEPLQECYAALQTLSVKQPRLHALPFACGEREERIAMFRSDYRPSSSLLQMAPPHKELYPFTAHGEAETVQVRRLDDAVRDLELPADILVKIDVQGFEDRVLRGGQATLARAKVAIVEVSFVELYHGQAEFHDVYTLFRELGFAFRGFFDQPCDPNTGRPVQADAIFVRGPLPAERGA